MKIKVTKEDIRRGVQDDTNNCAIARAIKRAIKTHGFKKCLGGIRVNPETIAVGGQYIGVNLDYTSVPQGMKVNNFAVNVKSKTDLDWFVEKWDENKNSVKPFTFDLELVIEIARTETKRC